MDKRKTIKALPDKLWHTLTRPPFAEVFLLLAVLIGMQQGYAVLSDSNNHPATNAAASGTPDVAFAASMAASEQMTRRINNLVDAINNPNALVHANSAIETVLVLASAKVKQPNTNAYQFSDKQTPPLAEFEFSSTLKQALFSAIKESPFTPNALSKIKNSIVAEQGKQANLDLWHANKQFALAVDRPLTKKQAKSPAKAPVKAKAKIVTPETIANAKAVSRARAIAREKFVIMLDPGHGGTDPGSVGHNGLEEKILTLDIAKRAERILEKQENIRVLLTRDTDTGMSRANRVKRVQNSYADMVVSLHLNHLPQADVNVVETFYAGPDNIEESLQKQRDARNGMVQTSTSRRPDFSFTKGSKKLASLVQKNVYEEVIQGNVDTNNAGVKQDTLFILTRSFTPGVLIELTCLSNIHEAERLAHAEYRESLAQALANGVTEYLNSSEGKKLLGPEV